MLTPSTETVEMMAFRSAWCDEHAALGQSLRAGRRHVVRLEHLEQAGAQAADQDRRECERDGQRRQEHRVQVAERAGPVAADRERAAEVQPEDEQQHDPEPERREAEPDERHGADDLVRQRGRVCVAAITASGTAISTESSVAEADQPERRPAAARRRGGRPGRCRRATSRGRRAASRPMNFQYWTGSGLSSPHSWRSSATRAGVAWLPRIVRAGSPGTRWIRKKTRIVTPSDDRHQLQQPADDVAREAHVSLPCRHRRATRARRPPGGSCRAAGRRSRAACSCTPSGTASSRGSPRFASDAAIRWICE